MLRIDRWSFYPCEGRGATAGRAADGPAVRPYQKRTSCSSGFARRQSRGQCPALTVADEDHPPYLSPILNSRYWSRGCHPVSLFAWFA
jgi:hypothetical protein